MPANFVNRAFTQRILGLSKIESRQLLDLPLDTPQRVDPVGVVGIGEVAEGQAPGGHKIDGEQGTLLRKKHDDRVVRVVAVRVDEFDSLAAQLLESTRFNRRVSAFVTSTEVSNCRWS